MTTLHLEVEVSVRRRYDGWAATTNPLAITMFGDTPALARTRALAAVRDVLKLHKDAKAYLVQRGIPHGITETKVPHTSQETARSTNRLELALAGRE